MKLLQVNKLYPPAIGGIEKVVGQLAGGFVGQGESQVLAVREGVGFGRKEVVNNVCVRRAGSFGRFRSMPLSLSFFYWFWLECKWADVIHLHFPFPLAAVALWLFRPKKPVVITWHTSVVRQKFLIKLVAPFVDWCLKRADRIVVTFPDGLRVFDELSPFLEKCVVVPLGVDTEYWSSPPSRIVERPSKTVFLYAGRLVYYKGLLNLFDAFLKVPDNILWIVGDGPLRQELESRGHNDRIKFFGAVSDDELKSYMHSADVFVFPSTHVSEVFGIVQLEVMAARKPIINTSLPTGVPWVARNGREALTVQPGSVGELTSAMSRLASDEELRRRLGNAGYERVMAKLNLEQMRNTYYNLYRSLIYV